MIEFHRKRANRRGRMLKALLRVRHVQQRTMTLAQVVPVDLLARLELDLALAELARDLGGRRLFCWVLSPALCDELPERFALLRDRRQPIQQRDVLDVLVGIEVMEWNFARQHLPEHNCVGIGVELAPYNSR
jgi:hypothetical protein